MREDGGREQPVNLCARAPALTAAPLGAISARSRTIWKCPCESSSRSSSPKFIVMRLRISVDETFSVTSEIPSSGCAAAAAHAWSH